MLKTHLISGQRELDVKEVGDAIQIAVQACEMGVHFLQAARINVVHFAPNFIRQQSFFVQRKENGVLRHFGNRREARVQVVNGRVVSPVLVVMVIVAVTWTSDLWKNAVSSFEIGPVIQLKITFFLWRKELGV